MKDKIRDLYKEIRLSDEAAERISGAVSREIVQKGSGKKMNKKVLAGILAAAVLCAVPLTAYAAGGGKVFSFLTGGGGVYQSAEDDESGRIGGVSIDTSAVSKALAEENGRVYFTLNGEKKDVTDSLSPDEPALFSETDEEGNEHWFILGGSAGDYGIAEFIRDPDGNWAGGYAFGYRDLDTQEKKAWYQKGMETLGLPWAGME